MSSAYVTLAEFKAEYKDIAGATDDSFIQRALTSAHQVLDDYLMRVVCTTADSTEYFDIPGPEMAGNVLFLADRGDICSITTVTNGDDTEITTVNYTLYPKTLSTHRPTYKQLKILSSSTMTFDAGSNDSENALEVTGKWALWSAAASVPESFAVSVMEIAAHQLETRKSQVFDTVAVPDAGIIQVPTGIPRTVVARMSGWRRLL